MSSPVDISDPVLREDLQKTFDLMRAGDGTGAVRQVSSALARFVEHFPEVLEEKIQMRGRGIPKLARWPGLGANLNIPALTDGRIEIEFVRERFSVSEAMTYYQFLLDEIISHQADKST